MNHKKPLLLLTSLLSVAALSGCSNGEDAFIIKALNCEDYIGEDAFDFTYVDDAGEEVTLSFDDVLSGFEQYESKTRFGGKRKVRVIYDTYDTNETMLSSLKTGKSTYDLIAASDYTIQKMMSQNMLQKIDLSRVPNYTAYCSKYHLAMMESITAPITVNGVTTDEKMSDYSVGYMWGTLGILYNPAKISREKNLDDETIKTDMAEWGSLWDTKYKGMMSVKDSMRDTYSVGIMRRFEDEIIANLTSSGCFDMESGDYALLEGKYEEASAGYNAKLTDIFNRCDEKSVSLVKDDLLALKENVFGFEVDSGKDDMVKGLVGMNLAWSGDAVYSMDKAENEAGQTLYYSIPKTGGNIWFDSWSIPATSDAEHKAVAEDFLNFLSDPQVAAANMETIGYTSFIAGDTVHGLVREWFDPRTYAMYVYHTADWWEDNAFILEEDDIDTDAFTVVEDGDPNVEADRVPAQFVYDEETGYRMQDGKTYFHIVNGKVEPLADDYGYFAMAGSTYEQAVVDGEAMTWEAYQNLYNATIEEELTAEYGEGTPELEAALEEETIGWTVRDLTYMFQGTLDYDGEPGLTPDDNPYLFYSDEIEELESGVTAGRQFYAQYPDQTLIPKLAVMRDYGANNKFVLAMWSDVKSNNLPLAGVVIFAIILAVAAAAIIASFVSKRYYHSIKVKRRKEIAKS